MHRSVINIGGVNITEPFALAPMAGVNCASFRLLCKECGAGLIYTQMYHCNFILGKYRETGMAGLTKSININPAERPVALQLIGNKAEVMAEASKLAAKMADIIDINFGCPDDNMVKSGCGAYFAKHPKDMDEVVRQVVSAVKTPVTAKIRIGWDSQSINGVAVAKRLEELGVKAVAVHGRVAVQKYAGKANWEIIKHIKSKLSIPVIGNGDINNSARAIEMIERTDCDIAMIGRRAMGDPGIFARCRNRLHGLNEPVPSQLELFKRFANYYSKLDMDKSFSELRTHAMWFSKRAGLGPAVRLRISKAVDLQEIRDIINA